MSSTRRENHRLRSLVILWLLVSVFCGLAGPFGTHASLSFLPRLLYWSVICAVSVGASAVVFGPHQRTPLRQAVYVGLFVSLLSSFVHVLNLILFDNWGWVELLFLIGTVALTTLLINAVFWLIEQRQVGDAPAELNPFLRRIPLEKRGTLQRLEAQDHYVLAVTDKGQALILMRFADALAEVAPLGGLKVHRSHWIMPERAQAAFRENGRDFIKMPDGMQVPVSRKFRPAAQERGLI